MVKFDSTLVTFTEVPDEIALCINCTCCPLHCKGCFEPWLRENRGEELTKRGLKELMDKHPHITCVCFMGGINDYPRLFELTNFIHSLGKKVALYSGHDFMDSNLSLVLDYYKVGPYRPECGPLNETTTNQKFYKKENGK